MDQWQAYNESVARLAEHKVDDVAGAQGALDLQGTPGLDEILARGDLAETARYLREYPGDTAPLMRQLHVTRGNAFVQAVLAQPHAQPNAPSMTGGMMAMAQQGHSIADQIRINDAAASAAKSLEGHGTKDPTGSEASAGMRALLKLPGHLIGDAIAKLTDEQFNHLLDLVPEGNREELLNLVKNTTDPGRKIQLWSVYHKAHVMADAARDPAGTDKESKRRHAAKVKTAKATAGEVDEETMFMAQKAGKTGHMFTVEDVDKLIARKDTEHQLEMKYNINFTTQGGARADGSHIHWRNSELQAFDQTLSRLPEGHLAGNAGLTEMRRQDKVYWDTEKTTELGGLATGTELQVSDAGASPWSSGQKRQGADAKIGEEVSEVEWMMTHELGHNVGNKHGKAYDAYQKANGWDSHEHDTPALTNAEKRLLDSARKKDFQHRQVVNKGGRTYQIDQDSPGFISRLQGSVPDSTDSVASGRDNTDKDPWAYARTRGHEQFAEHYDRAVHVPENVYLDLVENPHKAVEAAHAAVDAATTPEETREAKRNLKTAEQAEKARKKSFEIMRDDVFGTKQAQAEAVQRLIARHVDPDALVAFTQAAARVSTPAQIAHLEASVPDTLPNVLDP